MFAEAIGLSNLFETGTYMYTYLVAFVGATLDMVVEISCVNIYFYLL